MSLSKAIKIESDDRFRVSEPVHFKTQDGRKLATYIRAIVKCADDKIMYMLQNEICGKTIDAIDPEKLYTRDQIEKVYIR